MGILDSVLNGGEDQYQVVESIFPSEEEVIRETKRTEKYKLSLAERYANFLKSSVAETMSYVEAGKEQDLFTKTDLNFDSVLTQAYSDQANPETFKQVMDTYKRNTDYLINAANTKDVISNIVIDKFDPNVDNREISMAILMEEFQANQPEESYLGYAGSILGLVAREATVGTAEGALGTFGTSVGDWKGKSQIGREQFMAIVNEPDLNKKRMLARDFALQAKDLGIFGDNSLNYWSRFNTIRTAGTAEDEAAWLGVDVATMLPIGKAMGLIGKTAKTTGVSAKLAVASDALEVAEATGGKASANSVMDTALNNVATSVNTPKHTAPSSSSVASNGLGPTLKPVLSNEVANDYLDVVANTYKGLYTDETLQAAKARKKAEIEKMTKAHVLDISERKVGLEDYTVEITLGKETGLPFKDWANAQKFAKPVGGRVEPYGVNAAGTGPEGYVVKLDRNLNMKGLSSPTELGELRSSLFDFLASPEITSSQRLNTVLKRNFDKIGTIETNITAQHNEAISKISKADVDGIDQVTNKLNIENPLDGDWYDISTFKDVFYNQTGRKASQEIVDAYVSTYKLFEVARWLEADKIMKRSTGATKDQFVGSPDGNTFYRMIKLPKGALPRIEEYAQKYVYDFDKGKIIPTKDFMKGGKDKNLYQIVDAENAPEVGGKKVLYATGSLKVSRPILPSDVVPRISGGFRDTTNIHGFLVSGRQAKDLSDNVLNLTPTIVAAGRTAKELADIAKDMNILLRGLKDLDAGTISDDIMNGLIKANNGFNPSIEDVADLKEFVSKTGIDYSQDLQIVTKDTRLPEVGVARFENYRLGKFITYDELYSKGARNNPIIYGYGGGKFKQVDPIRSIERDYAKGMNYIAEREYSIKSTEGFINGAVKNKQILNYDDIKKLPIVDQIREAKLVSGSPFETERRVIMNRMNETNQFAQVWNQRMAGIGEFIFDKTGFDVIDQMSIRPDVALRSFAYNIKLGLFNIDQYIVQASSALGIMAISPMYGLKAAASYLPLRIAMINSNPDVLKVLYKRSGAFTGMTEKEFLESVDYMRKSGRFEINQNISEINATYDITKGMFKKVLELGRTPFNEGERVVRLMATNVAYREFRKAYPVLDVTTDAGFRIMDDFITQRADALSMNMTRASAAGWQQGFLSLPTQWWGYQAKLMENIFFSRNLSGAERARLGLSQIVLYGGVGVPLGDWAVNAFVDQSSEGIDKDLYTVLRYGILDYTLSNILGEDTAFSGRLAVGAGLTQIYQDILDKNFVEVLGGPSLAIATDTGKSAIGLVGSLFSQNVELAQYDAGKVLRNISSFDKAVKAYYLIQTGEFIDKKGRALAEGMSPWNAVWNTLGIPFQEVQLYYDVRQSLFAESQMINSVTDRTRELIRIKNDYLIAGDLSGAESVRNEILSLLAPLTIDQRRKVYNMSRERLNSLSESAIQQDAKTANNGLSIQLQKLTEGQ